MCNVPTGTWETMLFAPSSPMPSVKWKTSKPCELYWSIYTHHLCAQILTHLRSLSAFGFLSHSQKHISTYRCNRCDSYHMYSPLLLSCPQSHSERQLPVWLPAPLVAQLVGDTRFAGRCQCHLCPPREPQGHQHLPGSFQQLCVWWVMCAWLVFMWAGVLRKSHFWQLLCSVIYIVAHICLCGVFV